MKHGWGRRIPAVVASLLVLLILLAAGVARAQGAPRAIAVSNLEFRLAANDALGLAQGDYRALILEQLRNEGFVAVAENSPSSGKSAGQTAEFRLVGTARELECRDLPAACRLAIEWELLDARSALVVYRVLTRAAVDGVNLDNPAEVRARLVLSALHSLTQRSAFREQLPSTTESTGATVIDFADPVPSFDPEYDAQKARTLAAQRAREETELQERMARAARESAEKERTERIAALTPGYVKVMKWTGIGLMVAGGVAAVATYSAFDEKKTTEAQFDRLRLGNDLGWLAMGLGATSIGLSFALKPSLPRAKSVARHTVAVDLKPSQLQVRWCF